uniref:Aprataxin and PNK-like factor n=1 Tax=Ceratitis capitata TaxID=7213 RepID=W8BKS3_CERCA
MISNETEIKLCAENLIKDAGQTESSSTSENQVNRIVEDGAHCSNGIRVKMVAEINQNSSAGDVIAELNNNQNAQKRGISGEKSNNPKRSRTSKEDEALDAPREDEIQKENVSNIDNDLTTDLQQEVVNPTIRIKTESPTQENFDILPSSSSSFNMADIKPAIKVEKAEANSTSRESCRFGIRCYRRNPQHRLTESHPGDSDYRRPSYPTPPLGTPDCPYGDLCYRRNPKHFAEFNHPPETDFEKNYKNRLRQRRRRQLQHSRDSSELEDDYDFEDPFINDDELDSDYEPNSNDEDDDDDYDACDRAEE